MNEMTGYTLVEVMVATVLLAISFSSQLISQANIQQHVTLARQHTQASNLISDVLSRLQSNPFLISIYVENKISAGKDLKHLKLDCNLFDTACMRKQRAYLDLKEWRTLLINSFSNGCLNIYYDENTRSLQVSVSWPNLSLAKSKKIFECGASGVNQGKESHNVSIQSFL